MHGRTLGLVGIGATLVLIACGSTERVVTTPTAQPTSPPASTPRPDVRSETTEAVPSPRTRDVRLSRQFVAFALNPSRVSAASVPFARQVQLGWGRELRSTVGLTEIPDASAWALRAGTFLRGHEGSVSALALVRRHAETTGSSSVDMDDFDVSVGEHPHCAGPPVPAPDGLEGSRRVSLQPSAESIDSCLSWFTVDLFEGDQGHVVAVTLDLWEP